MAVDELDPLAAPAKLLCIPLDIPEKLPDILLDIPEELLDSPLGRRRLVGAGICFRKKYQDLARVGRLPKR